MTKLGIIPRAWNRKVQTVNNSSACEAPPFSRSIRNFLLDVPNFSISINESSHSSTAVVCFDFLDFLLDLIMNILDFQERFLASLSKDFVKGLLFLHFLEQLLQILLRLFVDLVPNTN